MRYAFSAVVMWIVIAVLFFFTMEQDGAPEWAKDLEVLLGFGIFLILLNQAIKKMED